jgi:hypothetical protein
MDSLTVEQMYAALTLAKTDDRRLDKVDSMSVLKITLSFPATDEVECK